MQFTVAEVPGLPPEFSTTFASRYVSVNGTRLHAVTGGTGPALLLLPAWPEFWYGWRLAMPQLAQHFTVVALDLRGTGGSDAPDDGYNPVSLAHDAAAAMEELGHESYTVAGFDLGMVVGYALATSAPDHVTGLWAAEAILPGISQMPPLLMEDELNDYLWHFAFNRLASINDEMVAGREEIYFGHQFTSKAAHPSAIPQEVIDLYVSSLKRPAYRRAAFNFYRALSPFTQLPALASDGKLSMPVVAVGGALGSGDLPLIAMRAVAEHVTGHIVEGGGHFLPEEQPGWTAENIIASFGRPGPPAARRRCPTACAPPTPSGRPGR